MLAPASVEVLEDALRARPGQEICGYLLDDGRGCQEVFLLRNWSGEPDSFYVAHCELSRARRYGERKGLELAAFIHSHASSLEMSREDALACGAGRLAWIIVCMDDGRFRFRVHQRHGTGAHP